MAHKTMLQSTVESTVRSIGLGYDIAHDICLKYGKQLNSPDPFLIEIDHDGVQDIVLPGGLTVAGVPKSINKCEKGERMWFQSDVLSFQCRSNSTRNYLYLGKFRLPCLIINSMFDFTGYWQRDAANTESLAFDGWCITLYTVALTKAHIQLRDHVKQVPSTWEPAALARFIKKFGTHIVVGVKMGGKDVIYLKQQHSSSLQAVDIQKRLKEMSDRRFLDANGQSDFRVLVWHYFPILFSSKIYNISFYFLCVVQIDTREHQLRYMESSPLNSYSSNEDLVMIPKWRGGRDKDIISHSEWLNTIQAELDVISMSFIPITSMLNGVPGCGFLNHALSLYLRYKSQIEELHQFWEFQLSRQWAPVYSDLLLGPQRKRQRRASLPVNLIGPKLYVCTNMVDVGKRPVTGLRLFLEGKKSNKLAIHLQHLCSLPHQILELEDDPYNNQTPEKYDRKYYEPTGSWKRFSFVR
ncbi:hypothetical protein ABZP36_000064 [Zizania latifolia]